MTPDRYFAAVAIFHALVLAACALFALRWARHERCRHSPPRWFASFVVEGSVLAALVYAAALGATLAANLDFPKRFRPLGEITGRLMGQALFGEAILLGLALAAGHWSAGARGRARLLGAAAAVLAFVYVEAYRIEPRQLQVRRHLLDQPAPFGPTPALRILHLTDIQTPSIGSHEERALLRGLRERPDLIVLTGDYVQDALGRPTEARAARDLRTLMQRIGFRAPLGIFATEGDVGPPCREVFAGTQVRCLTDENAIVALPGGETLKITGLSRARGRSRDTQLLARLLEAGPKASHQIAISHAPDFVDSLPRALHLVLAGHTHGGQFVLPLFGPIVTASRLPRRYAGDLHDYRGTPLHVSRGVGMERGFAPPVRFLCPPEICVLDVRFPPPAASVAAR